MVNVVFCGLIMFGESCTLGHALFHQTTKDTDVLISLFTFSTIDPGSTVNQVESSDFKCWAFV